MRTFARFISSAIKQTSTQLVSGNINQGISKLIIPQDFADQLTEKLLFQIPQDVKKFKPSTLSNIESQKKMFDELLDKYPQLKKQIEESKESPIILIKGYVPPQLSMEKIPKSKYQEDDLYKYPEIKVSEIMAGLMIEKFAKIYKNGQAFNFIYPTNEDRGRFDSFASDRELKWHADGWSSNPENKVALFCLVGNESAITEVVSAQQIIDYFVENKKERLLDELKKDFMISSGGEDFSFFQAPIIDKDDNIRFSEYGLFEPASYGEHRKIMQEAIKELNNALHKIVPKMSLALENGDILIIDNFKNLHRRITSEGSPSMNPATGSSRLLIRGNLTEEQKTK